MLHAEGNDPLQNLLACLGWAGRAVHPIPLTPHSTGREGESNRQKLWPRAPTTPTPRALRDSASCAFTPPLTSRPVAGSTPPPYLPRGFQPRAAFVHPAFAEGSSPRLSSLSSSEPLYLIGAKFMLIMGLLCRCPLPFYGLVFSVLKT